MVLKCVRTKKGNQYVLGMKAHIGIDVEPGLVRPVHDSALPTFQTPDSMD